MRLRLIIALSIRKAEEASAPDLWCMLQRGATPRCATIYVVLSRFEHKYMQFCVVCVCNYKEDTVDLRLIMLAYKEKQEDIKEAKAEYAAWAQELRSLQQHARELEGQMALFVEKPLLN